MIVEDVMDQVGTRLTMIDGLREYSFDADDIQVPAAMVSLPPNINYSSTYQRGMDEMNLLVTILVCMANDRIRRKELSAYADGTGPRSVKQTLESGSYTAFDTLFVRTAQFAVLEIAKLEYFGAMFMLDIAGRGN